MSVSCSHFQSCVLSLWANRTENEIQLICLIHGSEKRRFQNAAWKSQTLPRVNFMWVWMIWNSFPTVISIQIRQSRPQVGVMTLVSWLWFSYSSGLRTSDYRLLLTMQTSQSRAIALIFYTLNNVLVHQIYQNEAFEVKNKIFLLGSIPPDPLGSHASQHFPKKSCGEN